MSRKVFTAGEVLAAADVNSFLMDQTVMSFAGTAARGSAIPSPVEGMTTFLEDSNLLEIYDGSNYKQVSGLTGGILQAVSFSYGTAVTTTSSTFSDTGLTATITPKKTTSRILILTHQNVDMQKNNTINLEMEVQLLRGATNLSTQRLDMAQVGTNAYRVQKGVSAFNWIDSPNTTSATTYKTQHRSIDSTSVSTNFNNYPSHITLLELAG